MSIFPPYRAVEKIDTPRIREWLVFFAAPRGVAWWARPLHPGFRHVYAASYYADQARWVVFNPTRRGSVIELWGKDEFGARLGQFLDESAAVLRFAARHERGHAPALWFCVAAIKAHLGIRSWALTPRGLYRDLLARGAEPVEAPCVAAPQEAAAPSAP